MATLLKMKSRTELRQSRSILWANYGAAFVYALLILIPLYYIFISAFKTNQQIFTAPLLPPQVWSFSKFIEAQTRVDLLKAMRISLVLSAGSVLLTLAVGFLAAYAIARIPNRMAGLVEIFFSIGFLIPAFAILVPVFLLAARTQLLYNPIFLALFYSAARLSLTVILLASTIREIPREMEEAAVCDGANTCPDPPPRHFPAQQDRDCNGGDPEFY